MKHLALPVLFAVASMATFPSLAADAQDHKAHHPEATASTPAKKSTAEKPAASSVETKQRMQMQMKHMQEMHDKMMNAKTPEERKALMDEHMKTMQSSMSVMKEMGGQKGKMGDQSGMQMRMDMMEMMMQMMMDRMSAMPAQ
ncbi:MAG: hypothetical protein K2X64_05260 [Rhodocyclaceae bacterium]|nr:hypothetical protein [Rhodocyclaceae bacterium]